MNFKNFAKSHWDKFLFVGVIAGFILVSRATQSHGFTVVMNEPMANETGLAYPTTFYINLNNYKADYISYQVTYGSMSPTVFNIGDGRASTGTIFVNSLTPLTTSQATDFFVVKATTGYSGAILTVAGVALTEGQQWYMDTTASTATAQSIKTAINSFVPQVVATTGVTPGGSGNNQVVFTTSVAAGFATNNMTLVSNTSSITVSAANFTGGKDNACFSINGVLLCANRDWVVGASTAATAINIAATINANTSLNTILVATATNTGTLEAGVVFTTAAWNALATNYAEFTSTQAALGLNPPFTLNSSSSGATASMTGGLDSAVTFNTGKITIPSHGWTTALPVLYSSASGVQLGTLISGTTLFVIPVDANTIEFATTSANAVGGTIFQTFASSRPVQTTASSYNLTPSTITGLSSYKYQASNDGTNWTDLTTPSSYTIGTNFVFPTTSTITDVGLIDYAQVRIKVVAPTAGGLVFKVVPNAKTTK